MGLKINNLKQVPSWKNHSVLLSCVWLGLFFQLMFCSSHLFRGCRRTDPDSAYPKRTTNSTAASKNILNMSPLLYNYIKHVSKMGQKSSQTCIFGQDVRTTSLYIFKLSIVCLNYTQLLLLFFSLIPCPRGDSRGGPR